MIPPQGSSSHPSTSMTTVLESTRGRRGSIAGEVDLQIMKHERCPHCSGGSVESCMAGSPAVSRCRSCRLLFLSEFPSAAERASYYQDDYYEADSGARFSGPFERLIALFRELRARDISKRLPPRTVEGEDAFLDVGCGRGYLLDAFHRRGWRVAGTQLSETAIEACRKRSGLEVLKGELPELSLEGGSFRALAFYHVLEHLDRPFEYLK